MAQDLFRGYSRETGAPKCTLKIDLYKAFDSLHWDFLMNDIHSLGFPHTFLCWIYEWISTPMYFVKVNEALHGYFEGKKGLRQGDPISPYLFTIAMNVLSALHAKAPKNFNFHWKCKHLKLTHLFYANDVLLLTRGDKSSITHVMQCV